MADKKDMRTEHIEKEQFQFVQHEKRIFDKKFDTKPIGYFKDAMIRFSKNKTNVIASLILGFFILMSVFVPILSTRNAEVLEEQVSFLPPRIPFLENYGIADGMKSKEDQQVDMSTVAPEDLEWWLSQPLDSLLDATGQNEPQYLDIEALPATMDVDYVLTDTIQVYTYECTETDDLCYGGQNEFRLDSGSKKVAVDTRMLTFNSVQQPTITLDIHSVSPTDNSAVVIKMINGFGPYVEVARFTEPGVYTIDPFETLTAFFTFSAVRIEFVSDVSTNSALINKVEVNDSTQEAPILSLEGYDLSQLRIVTGVDEDEDGKPDYAGTWKRSKGRRLMMSFDYDAYALAFGEKLENVFSKTEYDQIMIDYADVCVQSPDPDNPNGWLFSEGCPIVRVIEKTEDVWVDLNKDGLVTENELFYNYKLVLNYARYKGYDEIPYYIFGTTSQGKDLFKMIWIGARTSLLLGLIVSAINISLGILFGAISGYYGGTVDLIMQRFSEIVGRIPWLVSLSIFTALVGPGQTTLILVLIVNGWIGIASITRTQFYRYKGREYVLASRTLGAKDGRLIFRHILPNGIGTIITASILSIPYVIFAESTLSYLGFGIGHGQSLTLFGFELTGASIGVLLNDGRNKMRAEPYLTMWPATVISILMITFNMFGNALRDAFNPALRGSE